MPALPTTKTCQLAFEQRCRKVFGRAYSRARLDSAYSACAPISSLTSRACIRAWLIVVHYSGERQVARRSRSWLRQSVALRPSFNGGWLLQREGANRSHPRRRETTAPPPPAASPGGFVEGVTAPSPGDRPVRYHTHPF